METQLYFWKPMMEMYKKKLSIVGKYFNKSIIIFDDIEKEADEAASIFYNNFPATENTDFGTVAEFALEHGIETYSDLKTMKNDHLLMTISMLYHMWEQQITNFTFNELKHYFPSIKNELPFDSVIRIFKLHRIDITKTSSWKKIKELKKLTNTIKHGEGSSAKDLRKLRPDFFKAEGLIGLDFDKLGFDILDFHGSVLLDSFSLQVKELDLFDYLKATQDFWDEMPERAYCKDNEILDIIKIT